MCRGGGASRKRNGRRNASPTKNHFVFVGEGSPLPRTTMVAPVSLAPQSDKLKFESYFNSNVLPLSII